MTGVAFRGVCQTLYQNKEQICKSTHALEDLLFLAWKSLTVVRDKCTKFKRITAFWEGGAKKVDSKIGGLD